MALAIGSHVWLRQIGKEGVISACSPEGWYKVTVGSLTLRCKADQIEKLSPSKMKQKEKNARGQASRSSQRSRTLTLDLHGKTVDEALEAIEQCISDAVMARADEIEVIHGLGSGKLQRAAHQYLKSCKVVRAFRLRENNPGTTVVYL